MEVKYSVMPKGSWERDVLAMARNFCDSVELGRSKAHLKVVMTGPQGVSRSVIVSSTPGDHRVLANTARQMKQVAAQVGSYR